jgi:hypothetical protein
MGKLSLEQVESAKQIGLASDRAQECPPEAAKSPVA